jgi:O-6-methylguanine DNA methyltransferase
MSLLSTSVYAVLSAIPKGQVISYAELARRIGTPRAVRAIATVVGKNSQPIVVPCHRVIKSNGELGNYTWRKMSNPSKKLALLKNEGVVFDVISKTEKGKTVIVYCLNMAPKGAIL